MNDVTIATPAQRRKKALLSLALVLLLAGAGYVAYQTLVASHYEKTDNAYVQANVVQITPLVGGTVRAIQADDTDFVKAGQSLVSLDPADARVALEQAESQLAQTVREVRTLYANNSSLKAQIDLRQAEAARAQAELERLQADVARRKPLLASGAVGREELEHLQSQISAASSAGAAARAAVAAAREQLGANEALTQGVSLENHPNVLRAASRVRETYLALQRLAITAPVDGWVARRSVQLGQRVAAGSPLMTVVGLQQAWVDANFKESQLKSVRIGQPATLIADVYGDKVEFKGRVVGLGAGTGAAFALLPAQNATGNWIKVVQRVPVRIALDPQQLAEHPLRVGLSMNVAIDVRDQSGAELASAPATPKAQAATTVFDEAAKAAESAAQADVTRIIRANLAADAPARRS